VRWIPDDGLIEITNLNIDFPFNVSYGSQITGMAIATNPDVGTDGYRRLYCLTVQPFIETQSVTVRMRGQISPSSIADVYRESRCAFRVWEEEWTRMPRR
jgi:hypothetical protein